MRATKVREDGVIRSMAVQIATGINWEGQRQVLAVEAANRESQSSWDFLLRLRAWAHRRGKFVVSDDHAGLKGDQRGVVQKRPGSAAMLHFLRNALDHRRKADDD